MPIADPVPRFRRALENGLTLLEITRRHATAAAIADATILKWKLAPDMLDFAHQWVIAVDGVRGAAFRLAGHDPAEDPAYAVYNRAEGRIFHQPSDIAGLISYVEDGLGFLNGRAPSACVVAADKPISVAIGGVSRNFRADNFLDYYVFPNLYFHLSIAYAILRHHGVPVGKADYEGADIYDLGTA